MNCPYCKTELDDHKARPCLDAWFAEVVIGWTIQDICEAEAWGWPPKQQHPQVVYPYSTDIACAWQGLEKMYFWQLKGGRPDPDFPVVNVECCAQSEQGVDNVYAYDNLTPLAITRACIKTKLTEQENGSR